jgi:hypothetical protein
VKRRALLLTLSEAERHHLQSGAVRLAGAEGVMKSLRRVHTLSAFTLALAVAALVPACRQPTTERIVARAARAMAGSGRIEDVKTLRVTMVYPDHEYPVVTEIARPNRMRTGGGSNVVVFDGQRGAFLERPPAADGTPQGPEVIDPRYVKDFELDIAFLFPAFFDHPSEYLGRELVEGVEAHKLGVVLPLGIRTVYFVDAESYLPLKVTADVTIDGAEYHPGRVFRDYRDQGGLKYPRAVTYWWTADKVETAVVELVEVNVPLGEERFAIPAGIE